MIFLGKWDSLADDKTIQKTIDALKSNNINAIVVSSGEEAKKKVLELIPKGSEVMAMTSVTLDSLGISKEINESGKFVSVRNKLMGFKSMVPNLEMLRLGSSPEFTVGSVHAVSMDGKVFIASNTGSQLAAYAYGSPHVIWVVGSQKIVRNADDAMKRIFEHSLPLESERARKAYGVAGSAVNKILAINKEINPQRLTLIFVNEKLGF